MKNEIKTTVPDSLLEFYGIEILAGRITPATVEKEISEIQKTKPITLDEILDEI